MAEDSFWACDRGSLHGYLTAVSVKLINTEHHKRKKLAKLAEVRRSSREGFEAFRWKLFD